MADEGICPQCHAALSPNAPHGLCPRCLMDAGLRPAAEDKIEGPGSEIGRYELLSLIGEGGMGLVYLAEQKEPVRRQVALKILKLGMDTMQVVARFRAEQQTLAMLEHPNIAQVFDAGTTDSGRPYFVMEYVQGVPITRYCDEQKLSIDERLHLFLQVCAAIQHAHQKGVLHRDIKPSNILVSASDHAPLPKIIDFGIAKAVHQPLTEQTSITEQGQLLGTPEYMSPEQADMAYSQVDTRSDVYSLGVVLYELLAGAPPFEGETLREGGIERIRQIIRDEEPKTPSARLTALGEQAKEVALMRRTQLLTLARRLKKELEWIPLKAMRKEPAERYQSVSELAQDVSNYLDGAALLAGPESRIYRTRKFIRKHAGSVTMVALVAVVIILGLVASILMGCRAEQARQQEASARRQVEQALARAENAEKAAREQAEEYRRVLYSKNLALADVAYRDRNIGQVRKLLSACPKDLRGWEWFRLSYVSDQALITLHAHGGIGSTVFSPDGKTIVSSGMDKTIKIWDADSGHEIMTLRGHEDKIRSVAFSPDGRRIASGSVDKTIRIWDVSTGNELMILQDDANVRSIAFDPSGNHLVSANWNKTIKLWDLSRGAEIREFKGHEDFITKVLFGLDGRYIISSATYRDGTIRVWDASTGNQIMIFEGHEGAVGDLSISPDGRRVVSAGEDKTAKIWDLVTGSELMTLRGHSQGVLSAAFSPDGTQVATGGGLGDDTIIIWDAGSGTELTRLLGHQNQVTDLDFSPDGARIVSGSGDGSIKIWEPGVNKTAPLVLEGRHKGMAFSPDGSRIVTGGENITIWDTVTGDQMMRIDHSGGVGAFSPSGEHILSTDSQTDANGIKVWDATTGRDLLTLSGHEATIWSMTYSPDGTRIASAGEDKTIRIWDAATGVEVMTLRGHGDWPEAPNYSPVSSIAFSPDGTKLVSGSYDYTVRIWNVETGAEVTTLDGHSYLVNDVAFSPDGKRVASASSDGTIRIWDTATGSELLSLRGHDHEVISIAYSPDGRRIISGSKYDGVKIWNAETGLEIAMLRIGGQVWGLSFSPDGKTIATASRISRGTGKTVTLWKSVAPAGPRRIRAAASMLVDELYEEHGSYQVMDKIKTDETLDESVRKVALQIADARLWQDEQKKKDQKQEQAEE